MTAKNTTPTTDVARDIAHIKASIVTLREHSTVEGAVSKDNVQELFSLVDDLIADLRAVKEPHKKALAVVASQKSRAARQARVAKALALLAEQEAAQVKA